MTLRLVQSEIVHRADGYPAFWPTLFLYWLRFVPFWIGVAFGVAATLGIQHMPLSN